MAGAATQLEVQGVQCGAVSYIWKEGYSEWVVTDQPEGLLGHRQGSQKQLWKTCLKTTMLSLLEFPGYGLDQQ